MSKGQKYPAAEIIRAALRADPAVASKTLARRLYAKHPQTWTNLEACRSAVRAVRGACGEQQRQLTPNMIARSAEDAEACRRWGALLPEPTPTQWKWHELPKGIKRWLIIGDIHLPHYDRTALRAILDRTHGECDGVLLNGDILDFYLFSKFEKDPELCDFDAELDAGERLLDALDQWGAKKIVWKIGNHEFRLERYLMQKAPELLSSRRVRDVLNLETFLDLPKRGVIVVPSHNGIRFGEHLAILHGHELPGGTSQVNPARGAYLKSGSCCIVNHWHRSSTHPQKNVFGTVVRTWANGCLCELQPKWLPVNQWNHAGITLDVSGPMWEVDVHDVINGKVV